MRNTHTSHTRALVLPPFIFTLFFPPEFSPVGYTSHVVIGRVRPPASAPFPPSPPLYLRSRGGWRRSASLPLSSLSLSLMALVSFLSSLSHLSLSCFSSLSSMSHTYLSLSHLSFISRSGAAAGGEAYRIWCVRVRVRVHVCACVRARA
jgi:hypothetical protein